MGLPVGSGEGHCFGTWSVLFRGQRASRLRGLGHCS